MISTRQHLAQLMLRLARHIGRRGLALLFFALLDVGIAIGIFTINTYPSVIQAAVRTAYVGQTALLPLTVWAWAWATVGVICAVQAFTKHDRIAFILAAALKMGWASGFVIGWIFYETPRAWLSGIIYLSFSAFVLTMSGWKENARPTIIVVPEDVAEDME